MPSLQNKTGVKKPTVVRPRSPRFIGIVAVVLLLVGTTTAWYVLNRHKTPAPITYSTDQPDETRPNKDSFRWHGRSEDPKYISLPSIQTEGFIQNVGVDQRQQVAVPTNIHIAGWFTNSVLPGQNGLSIIDGHLDGRRDKGIFNRLGDLKENDEFTIEFGNGETKVFRVRQVSTMPTEEANSLLFSQNPNIRQQLTLITCGGNFDQQSRQYEERVLVVAELKI